MLVTSFLLPIVLAPLTYLAIVGDRLDGTIKFVMGLPNARGEYFLGTFLSRSLVTVAAVAASTVVGFAIALAAFETGPDVVRFLQFGAATTLYALAFVGLYVAVSATVGSRGRAMIAVFGAYFLLVPFWQGLTPLVSLDATLAAATDILGVTLSETTTHYVESLSPLQAYFGLTGHIWVDVSSQYDVLSFTMDGKLYEQWWYNAGVLLAWTVGSLVVGYASFARSELQ
jgi:ABC-2 type transport system permease protein